ncbi:M48 family metalloprotease [Sphingomonas mesophila]|uniref:M48 family metalloprotease n=1 Tax=Sphingomonas mesophila TaxID=2303576 RepID=UPI001F07842C|nr:M48 family metalloprotease [Sphingomonas mesophila]
MLWLAVVCTAVQPAAAQQILRDSETELLFRDLSKPLIEAAGLRPENVKIVLIHDNDINAFVAQGQVVYVHTGLIEKADNANQLQGVIAHELGHVVQGVQIRMGEGVRSATAITLLSVLLGIAAAAAGAPDAGMGVMMAGQRAAMGNLMSFTRAQESSADSAGAAYLAKSAISGRGSIDFFKKLQTQEYRLAVYAKDSYDRTHPLSQERIQALSEIYQRDPAWNRPTDPALEARFQRVKAKLVGYVNSKNAPTLYPESDRSVPGHYARAYAYHLGAYPEKALSEANALIATAPNDPFFLELKGQILLESGRPSEALPLLRKAVALAPDQPMIAVTLGHALVATEQSKNLAEALDVLKAAVGRDNENPFAWLQLGMIYERLGDRARAALAMAESRNLEGKPKLALASARMAMAGIPSGTPDYLRAQDIALVSQAELDKDKKKGKSDK